MALTQERKGHIAMEILKEVAAEQDVRFSQMKRKVGNLSKMIGCSVEELNEFFEEIFIAVVKKTFKKQQVEA